MLFRKSLASLLIIIGVKMRINIKYLEKAQVFQALYNNASSGTTISLEESRTILSTYKSTWAGAPLHFDYFDAQNFLYGGHRNEWGHFIKINFSSDDYIDTDSYDKQYGKGKAAELIKQLSPEKSKETAKTPEAGLSVSQSGLGYFELEPHERKGFGESKTMLVSTGKEPNEEPTCAINCPIL